MNQNDYKGHPAFLAFSKSNVHVSNPPKCPPPCAKCGKTVCECGKAKKK